MKYDQFVGLVQNRARLASRGEAVAAIRATLETLSNRLNFESADNLAAQLPREIGYYIVNAPRADYQRGERFDLEEFFCRVAESEPADFPDAVYHARVVLDVVGEAVSAREMDKILMQLPAEYERLFEASSAGRMRPERRGPARRHEPGRHWRQ
jgi:uncharacterized protein (DUF2267 family)